MMMDVDYFKQINDTYGHAVGDRVLHKVGHLLKSSFRENDIVGRIGGDEFLIFMEGITSEEFAVRRMKNLQQYLRELPIEELEEHTLTCSMGAAFMPKDGTTFGELYKHADEALYTTKRNGRDGFRIYHEVEEKEVQILYTNTKKEFNAGITSLEVVEDEGVWIFKIKTTI